MSSRSLGGIGEAVAILELKKKDYRIIEQNFNTSIGEIDIIAATGKTLAFIEVKTRTSDAFGNPSESIDLDKATKIRKTASCYLAKMDPAVSYECRFDIVAIMVRKNILKAVLTKIGKDRVTGNKITKIAAMIADNCTIEHIEAAF